MIDRSSVPKPHPGWMKPFARMGYAARGLVYLVIALFALSAAIRGGEVEDSRGALETLMASGPGGIMALVLIAGLAGYSAWRFVQSVFDTDDHGVDPKGLAVRAGLLTSGATYAVLAFYVFSLWRGYSSESGGESGSGAFAEFVSGLVGARPAAWLFAAVFLGVAGAHVVKAARRGYRRHIQPPGRFVRYLDPIAMTGLGARGVVFAVIAILFFTRGVTGGEGGGETPGLQDALTYVIALPFGRLLLGMLGAGLLAFSLYSFCEALWRRINVEDA